MRIAWARVTAAHRRAAVAGLIGAIGSIRASLAAGATGGNGDARLIAGRWFG
jgi:hypothetical protein